MRPPLSWQVNACDVHGMSVVWCGVLCGMDRSKPSSITVPNETGYGVLLSIRYIVHVHKEPRKKGKGR